MTTELRSIGDKIAIRRAAANTAITAGGADDNTEVTGVIIDRAALGWAESAVLAIPYTATLAANETLSIAYTVQSSQADNMASPSTVRSAALAVVATGSGTLTGVFRVELSLRGAGRYVRANFTPDLSRANTDTAALSAVLIFGGANRLPA